MYTILRRVVVSVPLLTVLALGMAGGSQTAALAHQSTFYVSRSGSDANSCSAAKPCATIQHAVNLATPDGVVTVWPGDYNQTVNITGPVSLEGSGTDSTTIDGKGIDTAAGKGTGDSTPYFGVVSVQNNPGAGGKILIQGITVRNAFVTHAESRRKVVPNDISIDNDQNAADSITFNAVTMKAVQNWRTFGGNGLFALDNVAEITVYHSISRGNFRGALLEGGGVGGPATINSDTFKALAACGTTCSGSSTVYPAEGIMVINDQPGTAYDTIENSFFYSYTGFGIEEKAAYFGGNCSGVHGPCPGNARATLTNNKFGLGACAPAAMCGGIDLDAQTGNELVASVVGNHGTVVTPDATIVQEHDGGVYSVSLARNTIKQIAA